MKKAKLILQYRKNKRAIANFEKELNKMANNLPINFINTPYDSEIYIGAKLYNILN